MVCRWCSYGNFHVASGDMFLIWRYCTPSCHHFTWILSLSAPQNITTIFPLECTNSCRHMTTEICVSIGSGNGLLPDGTKPLPEPILNYQYWGTLAFTPGAIWQRLNKRQFCRIKLKIILFKLFSRVPGDNELNNPLLTSGPLSYLP